MSNKTFNLNGVKHHIVKSFKDGRNNIVAHKSWSKRNQRWRYHVDSKDLVDAYIQMDKET